MTVPVKINFEELIRSFKINHFGTPPHYAGGRGKNHRSDSICFRGKLELLITEKCLD